ncbi:MAG: phage tail protein, partial [Comamonas sp.]
MVQRTILPPQRSPLELAIDETAAQWEAIVAQLEPAAVRGNASFQPWLAMQWQVAQFAQYFQSTDALLTAALPWLFERGNAASVRRALTWLGYDRAVVIEEDGALLHVDLGRLVKGLELASVAHVVRASIPLHMRFWRVYHDWDLRPIRLDGGPGLDAALLDNDSGEPVDVTPYGLPVKLSQGASTRTDSDSPGVGLVQAMQLVHMTTVVTYDDRIILDAWRLDSELLVDASLGVTLLVSSISNAPVRG